MPLFMVMFAAEYVESWGIINKHFNGFLAVEDVKEVCYFVIFNFFGLYFTAICVYFVCSYVDHASRGKIYL